MNCLILRHLPSKKHRESQMNCSISDNSLAKIKRRDSEDRKTSVVLTRDLVFNSNTLANLRWRMRSVRGRARSHTCGSAGPCRRSPRLEAKVTSCKRRGCVTSSERASRGAEALSSDWQRRCCGDCAASPAPETGLEEK